MKSYRHISPFPAEASVTVETEISQTADQTTVKEIKTGGVRKIFKLNPLSEIVARGESNHKVS